MTKSPKSPGLLSRLNCASGKSGKTGKSQSSVPLTMAPATPQDMSQSYAEDPEVRHDVITVSAIRGHGPDEEEEISYQDVKVIGKGTFGVVYRAKLSDTGQMVAIKKVFHNEKFKNRELQMMRLLDHPNVITLHYFFYSTRKGYKKEEKFLNMIMEFIPETLWSVAQCDGTNRPLLEAIYVKLYMYQLFRCLAYIHSLGICHRDVKPQNLLLNPETHVIKLCDFGSAKELLPGETNVAYICSRYYRAPELILGATNYTSQIDVWSGGCVLAELLLGQPVFPGATAGDQLVEIIKTLGTPSSEDFEEINPNYKNVNFPYLSPTSWSKVLTKTTTSPYAVDLVSSVLIYTPSRRMSAIDVIAHPFFDELRQPGTHLRHGRRLPPLFNFLPEELSARPDLHDRLVPSHVEHGDLSPDSTDLDQLADDYDNSVNVHDSHSSSLVGKFRSSLKKKISIKGMSGLAKPPVRAGARRPEDEDGDKERAEDEEGEQSQGLEVSDNVEYSEVHAAERSGDGAQEMEEIVETTTHSVEEGVEVKKKKKKKRRPRDEEVVEQQEIEVVESTPVKSKAVSGGVKLPDFAASPVVTVETEEISYEMTTEEPLSSGKAKKTKRRTHKKRTEQIDDDGQVF